MSDTRRSVETYGFSSELLSSGSIEHRSEDFLELRQENQEYNEDYSQNNAQPEVGTSVNGSPHSVNLEPDKVHHSHSEWFQETTSEVLNTFFV